MESWFSNSTIQFIINYEYNQSVDQALQPLNYSLGLYPLLLLLLRGQVFLCRVTLVSLLYLLFVRSLLRLGLFDTTDGDFLFHGRGELLVLPL